MSTTARARLARLARLCLLSGLILLFCPLPAALAQSADPGGLADNLLQNYERQRRKIAQTLEAATVFILTLEPAGRDSYHAAMGSGFVVADGYILTNGHVAAGRKGRPTYYIMNSRLPVTEAHLVDLVYNPELTPLGGDDFALLRFSPPAGVKLPALTFNPQVNRMDHVGSWGYPAMVTQYDQSMIDLDDKGVEALQPPPVVYTEGTVSAIVKSRGSSIVHTAAIAGGNSGGPLVNRRGEVVGINTWGATEEDEGAFINAALTVEAMLKFLRKNHIRPLLAGGTASPERQAADDSGGRAAPPAGGSDRTADGPTPWRTEGPAIRAGMESVTAVSVRASAIGGRKAGL